MDLEKGIRFECQGSGNCCVSRGAYGFVYLSKKDIKKLSIGFKTTEQNFVKKYCQKTDGFIHLKELKKIMEIAYFWKITNALFISRDLYNVELGPFGLKIWIQKPGITILLKIALV